jgi:membrane-bound lytic murein transglycosylase A
MLGLTPTAAPQFRSASFEDLPGIDHDNFNEAGPAITRSCARMLKLPDGTPLKHAGTIADWKPFCTAATIPGADIRAVVVAYLNPWQVTSGNSDDGLFTGYYEASLKGTRTRGGPYQTPIRARPDDHVVVNLGDFKDELKGRRITGQLIGDPGALTLKPYPDRARIVARGEAPVDNILAWVDDPADAFFLEIQGSGRIDMDDGSVLHVGYAERNGQAYTAVGKVLVERGVMTKDQASMQSIRAWMVNNPDAAQDLMNENKSYIFFRDIGTDGPLGAEQVPLTPLRSIAVDSGLWSYGMPFYIDIEGAYPNEPRLQRLMVAQDTGGAIKGAIRGDVFWGYGDVAAAKAGVMKSRGNYWALLPKTVSPH